MAYFPKIDTTPPKPKRCPGCGDWYVPTSGMESVSCAVDHGPGSCCHYSETKVSPPPTNEGEGMRRLAYSVKVVLDWLCAATCHAHGCWILNSRWSPVYRLWWWAVCYKSQTNFVRP